MNRIKKWLSNVIKLGLTGGILYYLYQKGMLDFSRVRTVLSDVPIVTGVFLLVAMTYSIAVVRWSWLLKGQGLVMALSEAFRLTMIGTFFNTALPGAVSGDVVKGYYVVRQQPNKRGRIKAFTTLLMDRLLGMSALICVSFTAMLLNFDKTFGNPTLKPLCGLISLLWAGVVLFFAFVLVEWPFSDFIRRLLKKIPKIGEPTARLFEAFMAYESCRRYLIGGLFVPAIIHSTIILVFALLASRIPGFENVGIENFFFLVPFGLLVTAIPISPAGLGTGHAAFLALFGLVGSKSGADLFTAYITFQILMSLIGGFFYVKYRVQIPRGEQVLA